jgi:hypothetical protein
MNKSVICLLAIGTTASPLHSQARSFDRVLLLETKAETSASVSLGDIDGDGDLDVILAKGRHWPLVNLVLRNDGTGSFSTEKLSETADRTYSAALADLDGDGDLDIAVSNDRPDKKLIYLNNGKGKFKLATEFGDPTWSTRYISVTDLNGDHRPDILVANRSSMPNSPVSSYYCLNDGKGAFSRCAPLPTQSATIIVAADLDGDGFVDLLIPHRDGGQSLLFWNDGKANFSAPMALGPAQSSIRAAAAADIDGDGKSDVIWGDEKGGVSIVRNLGTRQFGVAVPLGDKTASPYSIGVADMDRDGKLDVVVGYLEAPGSVFFNAGQGGFTETNWGDGLGAVYGLALGDLDGDGWPDVAAARSEAPNAIWFSRPGMKK